MTAPCKCVPELQAMQDDITIIKDAVTFGGEGSQPCLQSNAKCTIPNYLIWLLAVTMGISVTSLGFNIYKHRNRKDK